MRFSGSLLAPLYPMRRSAHSLFTRFRLAFVMIFCATLASGFTDAVHAIRSDAKAGNEGPKR
jgi:hypothetical protein